jgi:hypothetical protein
MLADTSVWTWAMRHPDLNEELHELIEAGRVVTCHPVMLELLYSARSTPDYAAWRSALRRLHCCPIGPGEWERALEVYDLLAAQGPKHQRQVSHADLLIAVAAEAAGVPVLHYDADFERITEVSGIDTRWVRPRGSLGSA